jgi:hypothetical protein
MSDIRLDNVGGCIAELVACNSEVAEFSHAWSADAGELKMLEKRYERLYRSAMRGTQGKNADERSATAHAAVEATEEGISERIENLIGNVEACKRRFEAVERRSSNAQSILAAHRDAMRTEGYVRPAA